MPRVEPTLGVDLPDSVKSDNPEPLIEMSHLPDPDAPADVQLSVSVDEDINELAAAVVAAKPSSFTAPHLNESYRKMLLSQRWLEYREEQMKLFRQHADMNNPEEQAVYRRFFNFEKDVLQGIVKKLAENRPDAAPTDEAGVPGDAPFPVDLGADTAMVMAYQSAEFDAYVKETYPTFYKNFEDEIQQNSKSIAAKLPASLDPSPVILRAAGIELMFKKQYAGLKREIEASIQSEDKPEAEKTHLKRALSVLKATSIAVNPSGAFISYALGAIMKTETMRPLRESIGRAVVQSQESLLKPAARKMLEMMPGKIGAAVVVGCSAAVVAGLYFSGVIEEEDAVKIAGNVSDFVSQSKDAAVQLWDSAPTVGEVYTGVVDTVSNLPSPTEMYQSMSDYFTGDEPREAVLASKTSLSDDYSLSGGVASPTDLVSPPAVDASAATPTVDPASTGTSPAASPSSAGAVSTLNTSPSVAAAAPDQVAIATPEDILRDLTSLDSAPGSGATDVVAPTTTPVAGAEYKVMPGECLSKIAQEALRAAGEPYNYDKISAYVTQMAALNDIKDIDLIHPDDVLKMPPIDGSSLVQARVLDQAGALVHDLPAFEPVNFDMNALMQPDIIGGTYWDQALQQGMGYPSVADLISPMPMQDFSSPSVTDLIAPVPSFEINGPVQDVVQNVPVTPRMRP